MPSRFPDNTLPGFLAAAVVCDGVEMDVRRSSDGKLALSHDPSLGGFVVGETPWSVLAEVQLGGGARPCLLDEALAALPGTPALIEIKNSPADIGYELDSMVALEAAARARPGDAIISFNWDSVSLVRRGFDEVATGLNVGVFGDLDEAIRRCLDEGHEYLVPDTALLKHRVRSLPTGLRVLVWTSERLASFLPILGELASLGVSGIITDDPESTIESMRSLT